MCLSRVIVKFVLTVAAVCACCMSLRAQNSVSTLVFDSYEWDFGRLREEDGEELLVMDISGDGSKLVILVNESNFGTPMLGETYSAYAHVSATGDGRYMYNATYYPRLITLYMDLYTE